MITSETWQSIDRVERVTPRVGDRPDRRRRRPVDLPFPGVTDGELGKEPEETEETPTLPRTEKDPEHKIDLVVSAPGRELPRRQILPGERERPTLH